MGRPKRWTRALRASTLTDLKILERRLRELAHQENRPRIEQDRLTGAADKLAAAYADLMYTGTDREKRMKDRVVEEGIYGDRWLR